MEYKICTRCVMDTTDAEIQFDAQGRCNHCTTALQRLEKEYLPNEEGKRRLDALLAQIRHLGAGKPYDCIIGLSGGVDSSYLALKSKDWGLRPLIFHVDGGWNTKESAHNVQALADYLGYDLHSFTVDWEEMRDLQVAYLKSGLANQDVPQDQAFFAVLFNQCEQFGIKYWLTGSNLVSESILPESWGYSAMDSRQIKDVHRRFGTVPLKTFPMISFWEYCKYYGGFSFMKTVEAKAPLNWIPYNVYKARQILAETVGWRDYGKKHDESVFTKVFQNYILPTRFGYEKRKAHYSSLVVSGIMTREEAVAKLNEPLYDPQELQNDIAYVREKLRLSPAEWDAVMYAPKTTYTDYASNEFLLKMGRKVKRFLRWATK